MSPFHLIFSFKLRHKIMNIIHLANTKFIFMTIVNNKCNPLCIKYIIYVIQTETKDVARPVTVSVSP